MKVIRKIDWRTIGFTFLVIISLSIQFVAQAMVNLALGWKEDVNMIIIKNVLNAITVVSIVLGLIFYIIAKFKEKDKDYVSLKQKIRTIYLTVFKNLIWDIFKGKINHTRKINQWHDDLLEMEIELDNKNRKKKGYEENERIWYFGTDEERKNNKYCQKKAELRLKGQTDWIEKNIAFIKVNYDPITYSVIFLGKHKSAKVSKTNEYISKGDTRTILVENIPRLLLGIGFMTFLSLIVFDGLRFDVQFYVNSVLLLVGIGWNIFMAINYANKFCDTRVMESIMFRSSIADQYQLFVMNFKIEEPKVESIKAIITPKEEEIINDSSNTMP